MEAITRQVEEKTKIRLDPQVRNQMKQPCQHKHAQGPEQQYPEPLHRSPGVRKFCAACLPQSQQRCEDSI